MDYWIEKIRKLAHKNHSANAYKTYTDEVQVYKYESAHNHNKHVVFHFGLKRTQGEKTSLEEMLNSFSDYLNGKNNVTIDFESKSMHKTIFNWLIKHDIEEDLLNKLYKGLILNTGAIKYSELFQWSSQNKTGNEKKIILHTLHHMKDSKAFTHIKSDDFQKQLHVIEQYKFTPNEYPLIHNFFNHHSNILSSKSHLLDFYTVEFLKKSIAPQDWQQFSIYCPTNKGIHLEYNNQPLFEENRQCVYNLNLNPSYIKKYYPFLGNENDLQSSIESVLTAFSMYGKDINVAYGFSSHISTEKAGIHFISLENKPLDEQRIKDMFQIILEQYAKIYETDKSVGYKKMGEIFKFALIESALPIKDNKIKPKKI